MSALRILLLSPCWPLGQNFGGQLRALHTARALKHVGEVTVLVVGAEATNEQAALLSAAEFKTLPPAAPFPSRNHGVWRRLRWAVDLQYLNVHGCVVSPADRARIASLLDNYDLVWLLNSRTPNLLQIWRWPHAHLDFDDIPSVYLERLATTESAAAKRWKARTQSLLLHRRERHFRERFTTLSVCSEADRRYLGHQHAHVIPNGFPRPATEPHPRPDPVRPRIGFIGLYSYAPNFEGVRWFLKHVWPIVRRELPNVRFRLIGKDTDGPRKPLDESVDALGWMEDPADEIASWSTMVVPIRLGGGTRVKLADAFSRKCPVIATRFGAYGYDVQHDKHLMLADRPEEFAQACILAVRNPRHARRLAENAWQDFLRLWTWDAISPKVWAAADDCLGRTAVPSLVRV